MESSSFRKIFTFSADVKNLVMTHEESSAFRLNNMQWKIKICKTAAGCVAVYLVCEDKSFLPQFLKKLSWWANYLLKISLLDTDKWSCETQTQFKLLHKSGENNRSVVKSLLKQTFSHAKPCHGIEHFMEWNEFMEDFVVNNEATLQIEILSKPLMFESIIASTSNIDQSYCKFRVLIENVSKFRFVSSRKVVLRGIRWYISIRKKGNHLSIYLCYITKDMPLNWYYKVNATLSLLSYHEDSPPLRRFIEGNFRRELYANCGYPNFISWESFIDTNNGYVHNNCATLEFKIKVDEPKELWGIGECSLYKANSLMQCSICYECYGSGEIFSTRCGHLFCQLCFKKSIENKRICAVCNASTSLAELHPVYF